jgi:lipopolysaccharide export system permease protein
MTLFISIFILFMQFLWKWVDELVGKGLDSSVIVELFTYSALSTVPLALPMAVLLSSLMTFGNLAEHYELAALKSSGLSLFKIMGPLIAFVVLITIGAYLFSNNLLPRTNLKMISTLFDIRQQKPALNIKEGVFYNEIDGYSIRIKKIGKNGKSLTGVMIYDHTDQLGNTSLTIAESGEMYMTEDKLFLIIELNNGHSYAEMMNQANASKTKPFMRTTFLTETVRLDLSGFKMTRADQDMFKENHQMLNGSQLLAYIDTLREEINHDKLEFYPALRSAYFAQTRMYWKNNDSLKVPFKTGEFMTEYTKEETSRIYDMALNSARNCKAAAESKITELEAEERSVLRYRIEYWRKFTLSVACLLMFFVGAPLGAIVRKGGLGMPVVVSVVLFVIFWVVTITGEKMSKEGAIDPALGMWIGCAFFLPLGIWLTIKATADSTLFSMDNVLDFFRRLMFWQKKKKQAS